MEVTATSTTTSAATQAATGLADNFDTFLTLLTSQLQNQDPLDPLDSNQFTEQLVQFTQVEQSIASNKNLEKLIELASGNSSAAALGYLGQEVVATGNQAELKDDSAKWQYVLDANATETTLTITNFAGEEVWTGTGELAGGTHAFEWDGKTSTGSTAPDGTYTLSVVATDATGKTIGTSTRMVGVVNSVSLEDDEPMLEVAGTSIPVTKVLSVNSVL